MLGKEAKLRNRRRDLRQFLHRFAPTLDKPRYKFFSQSLWSILQSGSLVVARWLRFIGDRCQNRFWRHKRLLNQLRSRAWDPQEVLRHYQQAWAKHIEVDTPLIVDLTDLPRPRARKLKYLALVRDGSDPDHRLVNGYWCMEIYAYFGKGRIAPLLLEPYSVEDPQILGENPMILRSVDRVLQATEGCGVLVMDIGADRDNLLIPWSDDQRRFVVRLKGDRHLLRDNASHVQAAHLAESLLHDQQGQRRTAFCRVYLPERPHHPLYLVCRTFPGQDRPLMLLSSLCVECSQQAQQVLRYYRWRWKCEESARFAKTSLGLERIALRTYEAFGPLLLLATLAMALLTWMQLALPTLDRWLCGKAPGRHPIKFGYYRWLEWLREQISPILPRSPPR
jgi:hypothetical protein